MMKSSLAHKNESPPPPAVIPTAEDHSFYEYHWDGPKRFHFPVWQPRQTTLFIVFDGDSRRLFSSARILLYYSKSSLRDARSNVWDIQPLGSVTHSLRSQVRHPLPNVPTLPKLTVAFEVTVSSPLRSKAPLGILVLRSPASVKELRRDSMTVLLEREIALTSDTMSLSLSFSHSTLLCTPITSGCWGRQHAVPTHPLSQIEFVTTRIVRVLPPAFARPPRIINGCLPVELLIKTFEDVEFRDSWHEDLLSFAQVCRAWSCAMIVLQARMSFSEEEDDNEGGRWRHLDPLLDAYALAKALSEKPVLGYAFRRLTTNNVYARESSPQESAVSEKHAYWHADLFDPGPLLRQNSARFTSALIAILRTTKNLQRLHLGQLDPSQSDALFAVLHQLSDLQTFSIGPVEDKRPPPRIGRGGFLLLKKRHRPMTESGSSTPRLLSVAQLARCMARWPALQSLKVHHLHSGPGLETMVMTTTRTTKRMLGLWRSYSLRSPPRAAVPSACALTQLVICRSRMTDRDLVHLFGASTKTLERVVLDGIEGVTHAGLVAFLLGVSRNVAYLTVRDVVTTLVGPQAEAVQPAQPFRQRTNLMLVGQRRGRRTIADVVDREGEEERALDAVVDKMPRLRELRISGDVASDLMLDRRAKMFVARAAGLEEMRVPVVQLWMEDVPRLYGLSMDPRKWPGWCIAGKGS